MTVGYALALTQFVMVWVPRLRCTCASADRDFDPLAKKAARGARVEAERADGARRREVRPMTFLAADVNELALAIFALVVAITLGVTYLASKRMTTATDFWAAGRGITGAQNGFAIAGDYMSAASFLGIAGLIFLFGFDGFLYSVGFLVAFLTVLFLLAERMRNSGKYTIADVLSFRLNEKPARAAAALGTLRWSAFYLIAQMVGAGVLIEALVGIGFELSVLITGAFMLIYVVAGGMLATTWVQIIKAVLLMTATIVLSLFVLGRDRLEPDRPVQRRAGGVARGRRPTSSRACSSTPRSTRCRWASAWCSAPPGLPHILMRFFTVPDAKAARSSVVWAVGLIGVFYVMTTFLGFGARAILGNGGEEAVGRRAATWPRRCWPRSSAAAPARSAATCSWRSSPRWRSPRSSRWWPGS